MQDIYIYKRNGPVLVYCRNFFYESCHFDIRTEVKDCNWVLIP